MLLILPLSKTQKKKIVFTPYAWLAIFSKASFPMSRNMVVIFLFFATGFKSDLFCTSSPQILQPPQWKSLFQLDNKW